MFLWQREGFREHAVGLSRLSREVVRRRLAVTQFYNSRRSAMDSNKPAQNIQDSFLNTARKETAQHHDLPAEWSEVNGPHPLFRQVLRGAGGERSGATHLQARHLDRGDGAGSGDACRLTWRIQRKRWARDRRQDRCRRRALQAPKDKAFSVWEVLIARNPAARRVCGRRVPLGYGSRTRSGDANVRFWLGIDVRTRGRGAKGYGDGAGGCGP